MKFLIFLVAILVIMCLLIPLAFSEQQYNPFERRWETVPDGSNWQPRYNPFERDWTIQSPKADLEYNPFESEWEWDSGHNPE